MKTVVVPALKSFDFHGRSVTAGEVVPMSPVEAAIAARRGEVSLTRGYRTTAMAPAQAATLEPAQAAQEPSAQEPSREAQEDAPPAETTRRSRRYRRRDLVADPQLGSPSAE